MKIINTVAEFDRCNILDYIFKKLDLAIRMKFKEDNLLPINLDFESLLTKIDNVLISELSIEEESIHKLFTKDGLKIISSVLKINGMRSEINNRDFSSSCKCDITLNSFHAYYDNENIIIKDTVGILYIVPSNKIH